MPYKVLVVDDFRMIRTVFENAMAASEQFEIAGSFAAAEDAVGYLRDHTADLVIMDIVMQRGMNGLEAAAAIKQIAPQTKIILVTSMPEVSYLQKARAIGVESFWYKEIQDQPILELCERTMAGESVYPDSTPTVKIGQAESTDLTDRELEVLRELVGGSSNREIAEILGITERTVKMHVNNMLTKTGFRSRLELAIRAREGGIVIHD